MKKTKLASAVIKPPPKTKEEITQKFINKIKPTSSMTRAMDLIGSVLKAFQQNNTQEDYLRMLDQLSEASCNWYNDAAEEMGK